MLLLACAALSLAQTDPTIDRIVEQGRDRSHVMATLRTIAEGIGPRATGSPELERGELWAVKEFKRYGCQNVHREQWDTVPGWQRGPRQVARMVSPIKADFQFSTNVWTQGTNGPVRGPAVEDPKTLDQAKAMAAQLKGAWVLMSAKGGMGGGRNRDPKELTDFVNSCGIAGRVYGSGNELVHTHGSYKWRQGDQTVNKTPESHPKDIDIEIRRSDMERIRRWLAMEPVTLEFNIDSRWLKPIPQYNVIADLPGTEKPDEMVIICGHFDSWNGPGSQGANDNGTGSAVAIEAARILYAAGAKPKRTIRFILWSGEEQGLLGSAAYAKKHADEMPKVSALINDDEGTGYHAGYQIIEEMKPLMEQAIAPVNAAFPDLPAKLVVMKRFTQPMGSDHASFLRYGVPAFMTLEGGKVDYNFVWHTQNDRIQYSNERFLKQSATDAAVVAYTLANAPDLLPRTRKTESSSGAKP